MGPVQRKRGTPVTPETIPENAPVVPDSATSKPVEELAKSSNAAPAPAAQERGTWRKRFMRAPELFAMTALAVFCCGMMYWASRTPPPAQRLFYKEHLALYNGKRNAPTYLALLGDVFDVSKNDRMYGPDGGYKFFVGRDASKGFITGDFTNDLTDDVTEFSNGQFKALVNWRKFYHATYEFKGHVIGRFYKKDGSPTRLLRKVEAGAVKAAEEDKQKKAMEDLLPSCNMRWTEAEGGTVWCDDGKYPRKVFQQMEGGKPVTRCACFEGLGWSDLRQVYPDCKPDATSCKVPSS